MKKIVILSLHLLSAVWAWAAAPVGETVWLYHIDNASYVTADAGNGYAVAAQGVSSLGVAQLFIIEDVDGTNIALKAFVNGKYIQIQTDDKDKLYAVATNTTDALTHFLWSDLSGGKVRLTCIGDPDGNANVSPSGASEILRSNSSETGSETEFSWGIVEGLLPIDSLVYSVDDESVTLDWDDNASGNLDFYRVYRSSESGTNYVAIATNVAESMYTDIGMPGGITYYYVVTMVDTNGTESAFSNEIAAVPLVSTIVTT